MPELLIVLHTYFTAPKNSIENLPTGVALRIRRICDSDDKFGEHSVQYQKYIVARDYKSSKVKKTVF